MVYAAGTQSLISNSSVRCIFRTSVANTYRCLFSSSFPPAASAIDAAAASIGKITSNLSALLLRYTSLLTKLYYLQVQPAYLPSAVRIGQRFYGILIMWMSLLSLKPQFVIIFQLQCPNENSIACTPAMYHYKANQHFHFHS
jgi:hypothetical protein